MQIQILEIINSKYVQEREGVKSRKLVYAGRIYTRYLITHGCNVNTTRKHNGGNDTRLTGYRVWLARSNTTVVNLDSVGKSSATFIACDDNLHKYLTHFVAKVSPIRMYQAVPFYPSILIFKFDHLQHCSFCNVICNVLIDECQCHVYVSMYFNVV